MLEVLQSIDQSLFLFLNGLHCQFVDAVMYWGTNTLAWTPMYILLIFLVIRKYRWKAIWVVVFAVLMITVSDQLAGVFKDLIARPRPTHEPGLEGVHTVNGYVGGQFGFYSSHGSNHLALAIYMIILLGVPFRYFAVAMLAWAFFMSYTRIYLGVHYPGDILASWIAGGLIGWGFGQLCGWVIHKPLRN